MTALAQTTFDRKNLVLVGLIVVIGAATLLAEGYGPNVGVGFIAFGLVIGVAATYFAAFELSTKRCLLLALTAGVGGYTTQVVGATENGFWRYPSAGGSFGFVPAAFVMVSIVCLGVTQTVFAPRLGRRWGRKHRPVDVALPLALFVVCAIGSGGGGAGFWVYYCILAVVGMLGVLGMNRPTLVGLVVTGMVVGGVAEIAGASGGLWSFRDGPGWLPPSWLVFGSWPLEIVAHWTVSGWLARESLRARPHFFHEPQLFTLHAQHPLATTGRKARVISASGDDKLVLLDAALEAAGLAAALGRRLAATHKTPATLAIAIKPNFMFLYSERDRSTFTDPELVEHLVDWLRARGFTDLAIVEAQSSYGNYFHDRDVPHVAAVAGYRPAGRYKIVDLTVDKVPHRFAGTLGDHFVGKTWRDADFRISFAKNKTHTWAHYTLCLKNVYGALPLANKIHEYHYKREIYAPTIDLLVDFPVHFGIVDAFQSADGPFGIFADRDPVPTKTVLAGENIIAVDWVGAEKMGLDPMISRYMQLAVQAFGKPHIERVGDLSRYSPWRNVPRPLIELWDNAEECYGFTNTVFAIFNRSAMSPAFRPKRMSWLLAFLARLAAPVSAHVYVERPDPGESK